MTLSVKEQTAISRVRTKLTKQPQVSVAESIGVSATAVSAWVQVMRAIGVDITGIKRGPKATTAKLTPAAMAKARSTRSSNGGGVHAR